MAITSYSTLKTAITNWTHRSDMADVADDLIDNVEAWLNRELRVSQMETRATTTVSSEYVALPSDFIGIRNIQVNSNPVKEMVYLTPAQMDIYDLDTSELGYYTVVGDELQVNASSGEIEITYWARIPPLDDQNETNWLILAHPDVYLYGCLAEAFLYAQDPVQAQTFSSLFRETVNKINQQDKARKYGKLLQVRVA